MSFGIRNFKTTALVLLIGFFGLAMTFIISRLNSNVEGKAFSQNAEVNVFLRFRQLIMSNLRLVSGTEFERFLSVKCN